MIKKLISLILLLFMLPMLAFSASGVTARKIQVVVDGVLSKNKFKVYDYRGDNYFSVKEISSLYGGRLSWHPITGKVSIQMNNKKLDFYIKTTKVIIDGKTKRLKLPVHLIGSEVYAPADFVSWNDFSKMSETDSSWNPSTKILTIDTKLNIDTPRFYTCENFTKVDVEFTEDLPFDIEQPAPGLIEMTVTRGKIKPDHIMVDDGIVKEIYIRSKNRQAVIQIYLCAGAGKIDPRDLTDSFGQEIIIKKTSLTKVKEETICLLPVQASTCPVSMADLSSDTTAEAELMPATTGAVENIKSTAAAVVSAPAPARVQPAVQASSAVTKNEKPLRRKTIVLDAGHGGDDPGAVGPNTTKEKEINLEIVKELKRLFENDPEKEFEVVLTRDTDVFIPLAERTDIANKKKADLFVSIHCNAAMNRSSNGFEIYFLSEDAECATDPEAQATAVLENSVIKLEKKQSKELEKLQQFLWSMSVNEFMNESSELCCLIANDVSKRTKVINRGVRQAGFYVLRGTAMPAVLVECAYLSNVEEEAMLKTRRFQKKIADCVFAGVKKYEHRKNTTSVRGK
jgi:N-acetylmuramoyl-L-alanine amidase